MVDLSVARTGDYVFLRCGAKLTIKSIKPSGSHFDIIFDGSENSLDMHVAKNGRRGTKDIKSYDDIVFIGRDMVDYWGFDE